MAIIACTKEAYALLEMIKEESEISRLESKIEYYTDKLEDLNDELWHLKCRREKLKK